MAEYRRPQDNPRQYLADDLNETIYMIGPDAMVGDSARDVEAGRNAGLATVLLKGETYARELKRARAAGADASFLRLADAVDWIIERCAGRIEHGP